MRQLLLSLVDPPPPTLDNFVPGRNAALLDALRAFGTGAAPDRCLYLWGETGAGKSHLLNAWLRDQDGGRSAVDDVGQLDDAAQVALFNRYNAVREGAGYLLVTGDAPPGALALRDDLKSRLAWGLSFEVIALSDEEKRAALADQAARRGMNLAPELLDYLLTRARRDMGSLVALVDALDRHSLEARRPVSLPMLRDLISQTRALPF